MSHAIEQAVFDYKNAEVICAVFVYYINIILSVRTTIFVEGEKRPKSKRHIKLSRVGTELLNFMGISTSTVRF